MKSTSYRSAFRAGAVTPEQILAFHRANHGDLRMEEDGTEEKPDGDKPDDEADDSKSAGSKAAVLADLLDERKRRQDAENALTDAKRKLEEIDAEKLTEQERAEKERDAARTEADQYKALTARYEAAEAAGLPLSWAKRLVGTTAEELSADAKAMATDLAEKAKPGTPKPDPTQGGGAGGSTGGSVSAAKQEYLDSRKK